MGAYHFIGLMAYVIIAIGFFNKDDNVTKKLIIAACALNVLYFGFQELYISSAVVFLTGLRVFFSLYEAASSTVWLFLGLAIVIPFVSPSTDYIAIVPAVLGTIAVYWLQGSAMRGALLTCSLFWITNNYIEGAWVGFFGEMLVFCVGAIRLVMMLIERKKATTNLRIEPK